MAFEISFGPALANRVCVPCYEDEIIYGTIFSSGVSYMILDRWKIGLEYGGFYEKWQMFHDESSEESDYFSNNRNYFVGSVSYYPFRIPIWVSGGAGIGNYDFTTEIPILTQQGTYTLSTIYNYGFLIQGGIGFDYLFKKNIKAGFKIMPSYLFMEDLEFVTGETLKNEEGSFVIGAAISIGVHFNVKDSQPIN